MGTTDQKLGGCRCGAVRYSATGEARSIHYCHCVDCRGYSGAPVMVWVGFSAPQVEFVKGRPKTYESRPGVRWGFCAQCGSTLTWEANLSLFGQRDLVLVEFTISSFDAPEELRPDRHWMDGQRIRWFDVHDQLPRYRGSAVDVAEPTHFGPNGEG
jgi:hypothetical protein